MFIESPLSMKNYSDTLIGWSTLVLRLNVKLDADATYNAQGGGWERDYIIHTYGWTVNDGGPVCVGCP